MPLSCLGVDAEHMKITLFYLFADVHHMWSLVSMESNHESRMLYPNSLLRHVLCGFIKWPCVLRDATLVMLSPVRQPTQTSLWQLPPFPDTCWLALSGHDGTRVLAYGAESSGFCSDGACWWSQPHWMCGARLGLQNKQKKQTGKENRKEKSENEQISKLFIFLRGSLPSLCTLN